MAENTYAFDLPTHHKSIIKVIGVGGGGSNAVNHMFNLGIRDVEFVICNTDSQALQSSPVTNKLQIGIDLTSGLGAGANPEKGRNAAIESKEDIREMLSEDTRMVFITAGMGGGTGTGAAPVIAQVAREMDILTVGIVTAPFGFEGKKKMNQANEGIRALKENCDTVLVILNDKIKEIFGNLPIREAFAQADNVLTTAAKGIAEIITVPGYVNVDFEDVKTVMKNAGAAVMGSAQTSGDSRARRAAEMALNSPLLNNQNVLGAEKILLSIMSGDQAELQMDELADITDYMQEFAGDDADVIFGHGVDPDLGENIRVTVIATGFATEEEMEIKHRSATEQIVMSEEPSSLSEGTSNESTRTVFDLESTRPVKQPSLFQQEDADQEDEFDFELPDVSEEPKEEKEVPSFSFEFTKPGVEDEDEKEEEFSFEIDNEFEVVNDHEEEDSELEELQGMAHPPSRKVELMEARRQREELLDSAKPSELINPETFKEKWDVPAYERKKIALQQVPHSSERNVSRFNLTDDKQILGNNKFLHDNVD
ncbi:MAG: cell division protein FtsZ [Cyclobacteriaceae bacterium]|nr:cell division protein FtsZ [Cyclobacteriaceae bacterium HetDA_MAG_MS6]